MHLETKSVLSLYWSTGAVRRLTSNVGFRVALLFSTHTNNALDSCLWREKWVHGSTTNSLVLDLFWQGGGSYFWSCICPAQCANKMQKCYLKKCAVCRTKYVTNVEQKMYICRAKYATKKEGESAPRTHLQSLHLLAVASVALTLVVVVLHHYHRWSAKDFLAIGELCSTCKRRERPAPLVVLKL